MKLSRAALALLLVAFGAHAESSADAHLLAGAEHFRAGRFDDALVEFEVAGRLGAGAEAGGYAAAALTKLKRPEEALEAFAKAPSGALDPLLGYYRALACYDARLYLLADRMLEPVVAKAGPRIAAQALKMRADIAALFQREPAAAVVDWYHARGAAAAKAGKAALAAAYYDEAAALAGKRADRHRLAEAREHLAPGPGKP